MQTTPNPARSIVIEFTATPDELAKVIGFQLRRLYRQRMMLALGILLVASGILVLAVGGGSALGVGVLLLGLFYIFWITVLVGIIARRGARKSGSSDLTGV